MKASRRKRKNENKPVTRKRQKNENNWIDKASKIARNTGEAGIGRKGPIEQKFMKEGCLKNCRMKCAQKISDEERFTAFTDYYNLADKSKQWSCLNNWITNKNSPELDEESIEVAEMMEKPIKKKIFFNYSLPTLNGPVVVCRNMFLNTLGMCKIHYIISIFVLIKIICVMHITFLGKL